MGLTLVPVVEELDDQMVIPLPLTRDRVPWLSNLTMPEVSISGVSRLATHTTTQGVVFLYHIPMYRFRELPGLKKPSSNVASPEIMVSPSDKYLFTAMMFDDELEDVSMRKKKVIERSDFVVLFISMN
ncbi:hypothetical protein Hanom_Chr08g00702931 [Helianthus anomalus]